MVFSKGRKAVRMRLALGAPSGRGRGQGEGGGDQPAVNIISKL